MLKETLRAGLAAFALSSAGCDLPESKVQTDCAPSRPAIVMWTCLRAEEATRNRVNQVLEDANDSSANSE